MLAVQVAPAAPKTGAPLASGRVGRAGRHGLCDEAKSRIMRLVRRGRLCATMLKALEIHTALGCGIKGFGAPLMQYRNR